MLRTLFIGLPLFFLVLGIPLALRVVPQNKFYGFRTSATFSSPDTWYQINFATGLALVAAGVMAGLLALMLSYGLIALPPRGTAAWRRQGGRRSLKRSPFTRSPP